MAEYINNTPHASECWPANILIDPLKKVWEDGKVEQSEIAYLQGTLENIVKKEADLNYDGTVDYWEYFEEGKLDRV